MRTEKWQIELKADPCLLEKLGEEFACPELRIFHDAGAWFLESTCLDSDDQSEIYSEGEKLIEFLNNALWLYSYRIGSIESDGYCLMSATGTREKKFFAFGCATAFTRLTVSSSDVPSSEIFGLLSQNQKVQEALAIFNNAEVDWYALFKIYETVRDDQPDIPTTKAGISLLQEWVGENEIQCFRETAHWHRHSVHREASKKPDKEMPLFEARKLIRVVLIKWLMYKSSIARNLS